MSRFGSTPHAPKSGSSPGDFLRANHNINQGQGLEPRSTPFAIGTPNAEINTPDGRILIPNTRLTEGHIKVYNQ